MRWPRALALRLALAAGLWTAAGLGATAWFITGIAVHQVEAAFDARLHGLLDAAVAATALDEEGRIAVTRAPAGADFERPFSGAYWQVTGPDSGIITSRSLWDQALPAAMPGHDGVAMRDASGPRGERLRIAERDVLLPGAAAPAHVAVALSRAATEAEIARLRAILLAAFAMLGIGLVGGVVATMIAGFAPLRRIRRALAEVRAGTRDQLNIDAPSELAPLVAEVDALIHSNRSMVERARAHVGNLAHALKTPLAVLRNALDAAPPDLAAARAEAASLDRLVRHHLARARVTARLAASAAPLIAPLAVASEVASALRRVFAGRPLAIAVRGDAAARLRADAQDLTEMLGNLMENAATWARSRIDVTVAVAGSRIIITVCDDGPGLSPEQCRAVVRRGARLDEATPGSGLGLAIVADLAALHGGALDLGPAPDGGLCATLRLPASALAAGD